MKQHILVMIISVFSAVLTCKAQPFPSTSLGDFSANDTIGCLPLIVSFQSIIPNGVSWNWNFGNGNTSSQENPTEIFLNSGMYTITLDVIYSNGDSAKLIKTNYINVASKPEPDFTIDVFNACENTNNLQFQNNTIGTNQYLWDFGDGNLTTDPSPIHHYHFPGSYTTTLIATNLQGCSENVSVNNIEIFEVTQNDFQITGSNQACDSTYVFPFSATPSGMNSYTWKFSTTPQVSGQAIQQVFNTYGSFDLLLVTEDNNGCIDSTFTSSVAEINHLSYDFSASSLTNCEMEDITFTANVNGASSVIWDFGDGQQASGLVTHSYQNSGVYTVTMAATHPNGCNQTIVKNNYIEIYLPPSVSSAISDTVVCVGEQIQFDASLINTQSTLWDFGDGTTTPQTSVSHQYNNSGLYNVQLITNSLGCTDIITTVISVSQPTAQFQNTTLHNCSPVNVAFLNQTTTAVSWLWSFSNGTTSTDQNPLVTFNTSGVYDAQLIVTDISGCTDTTFAMEAVKILNNVPSNFQPIEFSGCNPISISFYNYVVGSGNWNWDFGDGTTSNSQMPFHTYSEAGEYIVSLHSADTSGCNIYIDAFAQVTVNSLTIDSFSLELNCDSLEVNFMANCPECIDGLWNFGDGNSSQNYITNYVYADSGLYYISYTGSSNLGCVASKLYAIDMDSCSVYALDGSAEPPVSGDFPGWTEDSTWVYGDAFFEHCGPFSVSFFNPVPDAQSWVWHFGDGAIGYGQQPTHIYDSIGLFSLMLEYVDSNVTDTLYFYNYINVIGHRNEIIVNSINTCEGLIVNLISEDLTLDQYYWSVDNLPINNMSTVLDTMFTNNNQLHAITLTSNDTNMCSFSASIGVISNGINPGFIYNTPICLGDSLIVSHNVPAGYQINWDYGTNNSSNLPFNIYSNSGTYNIKAEVMDSAGCIINFNIGQVDVIGPINDFNLLSASSMCVGDTIHVEALQGTNQSYVWNIGNSIPVSNGPAVSVVLLDSGTFDIELETTLNGCVSSYVQQAAFVVHQAIADFNFTQNNYCLPVATQFTDASISPISWSWSFGDGDTSNIQNPVYIYSNNPNNQITLEITDVNGCDATITKNNIELFDVDITASSSSGCAPAPITFVENSQNAIDWYWDFGDGTTSLSHNPTHSYLTDGVYSVSLIVTSADGCIDSVYYPSMVEIDDVIANFSSVSSDECAPQPAYFMDSSYNAVSWDWDFGNGFTSSLQNPVQVYYVGGSYSIQLIVESASGCADTVMSSSPLSIIGPNSDFSIVDSVICSYDSIEFLNNSQNAVSYMWLFGDGNSSTSYLPSYEYSASGIYNITLVTKDSNGCQSIETQPTQITMVPVPNATFELSDTIGCAPLTINANANLSGLQYEWLLNSVNIGNDTMYIDTLSTGSYMISLITESQEGCVDTSAITNIEVHPVYNVQLMPLSSVCETQDTVVVGSLSSIGSWYINGMLNPDSVFDISNLNPGDYVITKEISTYCGDSDTVILHIDSMVTAIINTPLIVCEYDNEFTLHSTSNNGYWNGSGITNPYAGLLNPSVSNYGDNTIMYTLTNGACTYNDSVIIRVNMQPNSQFSFIGANFCEGKNIEIKSPENESTANYLWSFESDNDTTISTEINPDFIFSSGVLNISLAVEDNGCKSKDSLIEIIVFDTIAPNTPSIIRSTVFEKFVLTEWEKPLYGIEKITGFQIWRSVDSINFSFVDVVERTELSYLDTETMVAEQNYYYLIIPSNVCQVIPEINDMSSSILLEREQLSGDLLLFTWSEYYKWEHGVDYYELQKLDENGNWITIRKINSDSYSVIIDHP